MTNISTASEERLLSRQECERIEQRILNFSKTKNIHVKITTWWQGELRWARNRVSLAGDRHDIQVYIMAEGAGVVTNQNDDTSLEAAVRAAEFAATWRPERTIAELSVDPPVFETPVPMLWSDTTYQVTAAERGKLARLLVAQAEVPQLLSAGYIQMRAGEVYTSQNRISPALYSIYTEAQCSVTIRQSQGIGSGWAGQSGFDWAAIDSPTIAVRALERCTASLDPARIEPGRYTAILEAQAVCDLMNILMVGRNWSRIWHERFQKGPFLLGRDPALGIWRTKLGLKIMDERITISHDPLDPLLGVVPDPGLGPITWIERGVLADMNYAMDGGNIAGTRTFYSLPDLNQNESISWRPAFRMSGGTTTTDEMIATTQRGLLVTRFSNLEQLDENSLLVTGTTRDGLWLIEHGKISRSVNNFRITESPLFVLNQIEQLGIPVPVFRPAPSPYEGMLTPAIVPPLKVNDFSFTATVDAV